MGFVFCFLFPYFIIFFCLFVNEHDISELLN